MNTKNIIDMANSLNIPLSELNDPNCIKYLKGKLRDLKPKKVNSYMDDRAPVNDNDAYYQGES